MCDMITWLMLDAISRKSTELSSGLTRKTASPCARESAGVGSPGFVGVKTFSSPGRCVPRLMSAFPPAANNGTCTSDATGPGCSPAHAATAPTSTQVLTWLHDIDDLLVERFRPGPAFTAPGPWAPAWRTRVRC